MKIKHLTLSIVVGLLIGLLVNAAAITLQSVVGSDTFSAQDVIDTDLSGQNFLAGLISQKLDSEKFEVTFEVQILTSSSSKYEIASSTQTVSCTAEWFNDCVDDQNPLIALATRKSNCATSCKNKVLEERGHQKHLTRQAFLKKQEELSQTDHFATMSFSDFEMSTSTDFD